MSPSQTADDRHAAAPEPRHERTTRHRTAKATGYGATTLDNGTLRGFFLIDGTFRRRIRPIAQETAHAMAARMK